MFKQFFDYSPSIFRHFSRRARIQFVFHILTLIFTNIFDLLGVFAMGLLLFISLNGTNSDSLSRVPGYEYLSSFLSLEKPNFLIGIVVTGFILKSVFGLWASHSLFRFLGFQTSDISTILFKEMLCNDDSKRKEITSQERAVLLTFGSQAAVFDALGYSAIAVSEIFLILAISCLLVLLMPLIGILVIVYFVSIAYLMSFTISRKSHQLEVVNKKFNTEAIELIQSSLLLKQEISIFRRGEFFEKKYRKIFSTQTAAISSLQVLGIIPKYLLESFLVIGAVFIGVVSTLIDSEASLVAQMALVLTAAFRIMPSFLRLQSSITQVSRSFALSPQVAEILNGVHEDQEEKGKAEVVQAKSSNVIEVRNLSFKYSDLQEYAISDLSFSVPRNCVFAITGDSGVGKTTLINLILGFLKPSNGQIDFSGANVDSASRIGFVPQNSNFVNSSIRENIALGIDSDEINDREVRLALGSANILQEVEILPRGIYEELGEASIRFSGGQRQRLNVARALYNNPEVLVFDEPTSALDDDAKMHFGNLLASLSKEKTILLVSHDDYLIKRSDHVLKLY